MATEDTLLSIGDAAKYIDVSIDTLRRWEKKGRINAYRSSGGHRYFDKDDLKRVSDKKYERFGETAKRTSKKKLTTVELPPESTPINITSAYIDGDIRQIETELEPPFQEKKVLEPLQEPTPTQNTSPLETTKTNIVNPTPTQQIYTDMEQVEKSQKISIPQTELISVAKSENQVYKKEKLSKGEKIFIIILVIASLIELGVVIWTRLNFSLISPLP